MNSFKLVLRPLRRGLQAGANNTVDVLVSVEAPDAPPDFLRKRAALNLALVIDRSGSMRGRPLAEAKRCAQLVVDRLTVRDRVAVVQYDDGVNLLVPSQPVEDRDQVRRRIASISPGGCTNLFGGWLRGADEVLPNVAEGTISRVLLLSDGLANAGVTDRDNIFRQCRALAERGVTTSTYGLGQRFDELLMTGMAKAGRGNAYYGITAEDLMDPFEEELQLLSAVCGRDVQLSYEGFLGARVELLNAYPQVRPGVVRLPDLAFDSEAWAILRVRVPADAVPEAGGAGRVPVLGVSVTLTAVDEESSPDAIAPQVLELPVLDADEFADLRPDTRVLRRVAELDVADIERRARDAADAGDWRAVERLLDRALEVGAESDWALRAIGELRRLAERRDGEELKKESLYASIRKGTGLSAKEGAVTDSTSDLERRFLREKTRQGSGR